MLVIREEDTVRRMEESVTRSVDPFIKRCIADTQDDILPTFGAGPNDLVRHFSPTKPSHL